ncbi:DsrE family protein [Sporosarcina psychrophila]|uniref:DsrE family protein n=1 Tax=Sporosarcina psychrophila TaxID=1476 RepID=UPI0030D10557
MKVFIIETSSPFDVSEERSESKALTEICKMMDHEVAMFFAKSKREFEEICNYISSIEYVVERKDEEPICIHLSSHGNEKGILFGRDNLSWKEVSQVLTPIFTMDYEEDIFLVVSSCGTDRINLHSHMKNIVEEDYSPPKYIFSVNEEETEWRDAALIWTILYHQIDSLDSDEKLQVQGLLNRISGAGLGKLKYHRWDEDRNKYLQHSGKITV